MSESVYEISDSVSADLKDNQNPYENRFMKKDPEPRMSRSNNMTSVSDRSSAGHRWYKVVVVILLMLVVVLLSATATLWVKFNNMSGERDQFQEKTDELQNRLSQLKKDINTPGWRYFSSSIYYISTEKKSWSESREDCNARGADLVIINSRDEQDIVEVWRRGEGAWIGADDKNREGTWKWVDGTEVRDGFWSSGEPNDKGEEDCAVSGYRSEPVPNWVDISCDSKYIWICEKNINM